MSVEIKNDGSRVTAILSGDIDHHNLIAIRGAIDTRLENSQPKLLILDFSGVDFMDSSGIGLILGRKRIMDSMNGNIAIQNAKPYILKIIKLSGLDKLINNSGKGDE